MSARTLGVVVVLLFCTSCQSLQIVPPTPPTDWARLQALPAGTEVRLVMRSGKRTIARVVAANDQQFEVRVPCVLCSTRNRTYTSDDLDRVLQRGARHTKEGARNGALIGLGASVLILATGLASAEPANRFAVLFTAWFTGYGAGLGALFGFQKRDETLVWTSVP